MGGSTSHPAGNRMAPPTSRKKLIQNNYREYWTLRPELPDRYHKNTRFDKFRELPEVTKPVWSFDLAEFTMVLAAALADHGVHIWDLLMDPPELKVSLRAHKAHVWAVLFTPNELALATGSGDKTIRIWNAETGMPLQILEAHTEGIRCLAFSMQGVLLSGGMDSQICMWEYESNVPSAQWKAHEGHVHSISFVNNRTSQNGSLALSVGADGTVAGWCVEKGSYKPLGRFPGGSGKGVLCVAQHTSQDNWCACGNEDGAVYIWNFAKPDLDMRHDQGSDQDNIDIEGSVKLVGHKKGVRTIAFTPDGCLLASGSTDGHIRVWDIRKMHTERHEVSCLAVFDAHDSWVTELRFEGGARGLVTCSSDGLVKHWVAPTRIKAIKGEVPQFPIVIRRLPGFVNTKLGVDLKFHEGGLLVCKVSEGLLEEHNKKNPQKVVMPGDKILSINGISGDPKAMLEATKKEDTLEMMVKLHVANVHKQLAQPHGFPALKVRPDHKAENDEVEERERKARHINEFTRDRDTTLEDERALEQVKALFLHKKQIVSDSHDDTDDSSDEEPVALHDAEGVAALPAMPTHPSPPASRPGRGPRQPDVLADEMPTAPSQASFSRSPQQPPSPLGPSGLPRYQAGRLPGGMLVPPPPPPPGAPVAPSTPTLGGPNSWTAGRPQGRLDPRGDGKLLQGRLVSAPQRTVMPRAMQAHLAAQAGLGGDGGDTSSGPAMAH